jgi:hypothetical protein
MMLSITNISKKKEFHFHPLSGILLPLGFIHLANCQKSPLFRCYFHLWVYNQIKQHPSPHGAYVQEGEKDNKPIISMPHSISIDEYSEKNMVKT